MTVSDQMISVLDELCSKFGIVIDWTSENVLPYAKELLGKFITYEIVTSVIWIVIGVTGLIATYAIRKNYCKKNAITFETNLDDMTFGLTILLIIVLLAIIPMIFIQIFDIATCLTFPEKIIFNTITLLMQAS